MDFTIPDQATSAAIILAGLSLFGLLIRQIGPWRTLIIQEEAQFRANLIAANESLTRRILKVEKILQRERAIRNAERSLDRHKVTNLTACLDSSIRMLEMNPDRALEVIEKIKEMRAVQMVAEAQEAAIIHAAEIAADESENGEENVNV